VERYSPPTNSFLLLGVYTFVSNLVKIDEEIRPWECPQMDRHTHTRTHGQTQNDFIICPMLYVIAIRQIIIVYGDQLSHLYTCSWSCERCDNGRCRVRAGHCIHSRLFRQHTRHTSPSRGQLGVNHRLSRRSGFVLYDRCQRGTFRRRQFRYAVKPPSCLCL